MKKLATILITVMMVATLSTPVFALGADSKQRGYVHRGYGHQRVYVPVRRVYHQTYNRYAYSPNPGLVLSLPLVPLPGISHMFPNINIRIR
jgi:hypothetical protein